MGLNMSDSSLLVWCNTDPAVSAGHRNPLAQAKVQHREMCEFISHVVLLISKWKQSCQKLLLVS